MSCTIYWFSATGNSRAVAESLRDQLDETELVWMGAVAEGDECAAESVGFVFPVYYFGLPNIVRRVAATLAIAPQSYVFSVVTGDVPGACHGQLRDILKRREIVLSAGWSIPMPTNYTPLSAPPGTEKCRRDFERAEAATAEIAEAVSDKIPGRLRDSVAPARWLSRLFSNLKKNRIPRLDRKFFVHDDCSSCGTCERVCPVGNIILEDGKPAWQGHCEQCFACLHWCPVETIQWGRATRNRPRYHFPGFSAEDFFLRPGTELTEEERRPAILARDR